MKVHLIKHVKAGDVEFDIDYYEDHKEPMSTEEKKHLVFINLVVWLAPVCLGVLDHLLK